MVQPCGLRCCQVTLLALETRLSGVLSSLSLLHCVVLDFWQSVSMTVLT